MNNVNKTLYIPLYGKAYVSKMGIILHDARAEEIWEKEGFKLKGKSKSKWLAYYMGMRSRVFDNWVKEQIGKENDTVVIHIGCGMDSRAERIGASSVCWYDVDFPQVIAERKKYYSETEDYKMISADARHTDWLAQIKKSEHAIIVMEGLCMYLSPEETRALMSDISNHFNRVNILMDCYTVFAAKASKYKNPINDVGVTEVYGIDDPKAIETKNSIAFVREHNMTPDDLINELSGLEKVIFNKLYAGKISKKMYRLYEFGKE